MQKLINRPENVVREMLEGMLALDPELALLSHHNVLIRRDIEGVRDRQVAIISGGGSGHEPAHAGFVGPGMLSAAVAGEVFTSPAVDSVLAAIRAVAGRLGALLIVKNYTGDRLNFGVAAEMARAEGYLIETVIVADDVALARSQDHAGRRGLAGTVLVHKIAGAAAAEGLDLPQVASLAQAAANDVATMGVALSGVTLPGMEKPAFTLDGEIELGLGIHGEPGVRRVPILSADQIVDQLLHETLAYLRAAPGDRLAALLNNLGATTSMEMAIAARRAFVQLANRGFFVERLYTGALLTSLNMAGLSLSLLRVDDARLRLLDAPTPAPAWPKSPKEPASPFSERSLLSLEEEVSASNQSTETAAGRKTERVLTAVCDALEQAESQLTSLDAAVGDGDLGQSMSRAVGAIKHAWQALPFDEPPALLRELGLLLQKALGGSSGPLYGVLLLRTGISLESVPPSDFKHWSVAMLDGCEAIGELGGARLGDRTMLDALVPFAQSLGDDSVDEARAERLAQAAEAAQRGAERTAHLTARRGRSSYLGGRALGHPDPGAVAASIWLQAIANELSR